MVNRINSLSRKDERIERKAVRKAIRQAAKREIKNNMDEVDPVMSEWIKNNY